MTWHDTGYYSRNCYIYTCLYGAPFLLYFLLSLLKAWRFHGKTTRFPCHTILSFFSRLWGLMHMSWSLLSPAGFETAYPIRHKIWSTFFSFGWNDTTDGYFGYISLSHEATSALCSRQLFNPMRLWIHNMYLILSYFLCSFVRFKHSTVGLPSLWCAHLAHVIHKMGKSHRRIV